MPIIIKPDKSLLEITRKIVEQNGEILNLNKVLIKLFSIPTICTKAKEK